MRPVDNVDCVIDANVHHRKATSGIDSRQLPRPWFERLSIECDSIAAPGSATHSRSLISAQHQLEYQTHGCPASKLPPIERLLLLSV